MSERSWEGVVTTIDELIDQVDAIAYQELIAMRPFSRAADRTPEEADAQRRIARLRRTLEKARHIARECEREPSS